MTDGITVSGHWRYSFSQPRTVLGSREWGTKRQMIVDPGTKTIKLTPQAGDKLDVVTAGLCKRLIELNMEVGEFTFHSSEGRKEIRINRGAAPAYLARYREMLERWREESWATVVDCIKLGPPGYPDTLEMNELMCGIVSASLSLADEQEFAERHLQK